MVSALNKILLISLLATKAIANGFIPNESCIYESEKYWKKIISLCAEGDIACDKGGVYWAR